MGHSEDPATGQSLGDMLLVDQLSMVPFHARPKLYKCASSFAETFQNQFGMQMAVSEFSVGTSDLDEQGILI